MKDRVEEGLKKYGIIAPLLKEELESAEKQEIRTEILQKEGISERTLRRYVAAYKKEKFNGLKPKARKDKGCLRSLREEILEEAIKLKEELPGRSTRKIIEILVREKKAGPYEVSATTLNRHLKENGYGKQEMKRKREMGMGSKRFQKKYKGSLWQADIKYGPYLPDPENPGKKKKTYLLAIIDDATRYIVHGEFYFSQGQPILEDSFRKALIENGIPEAIYIDNGKIFISKWFRAACAYLKIIHINAAPYSPWSKGKIERFNRTVDEFIEELSLEDVKNIERIK